MLQIIATIIAFVLLFVFTFIYRKGSKKDVLPEIPEPDLNKLLSEHVRFYNKLDDAQKIVFENRVEDFLSRTAITGVGTTITELDKALVGASAIIPIFAFPDWKYNNVDEVLIYKDTFNEQYSQTDAERNILGMVGDGAMNDTMILSQQALHEGFDKHDAGNTGIHEFAHLLDKADGSTDGVPEYLIDKQHAAPWLKRIREEIMHIRNADIQDADINPYAATNEAEFFAVITEYFFEKPELLKEHHPQLFEDLEEIFKQKF